MYPDWRQALLAPGYDMVQLIRRIQEEKSEDGFPQMLSQQFDQLVAGMNRSEAAQATEAALFGDPAAAVCLNQTKGKSLR